MNARISARPARSWEHPHRSHEPAADDHAIRDLTHRGDLLRGAHPESDRDRHVAAARTRSTTSPSSAGRAARSPVTPVTDTTYTKPRAVRD